ncbi:MAG: hypothetical protein LC800_17690 [Acidobacteria bacterium]|nr:hypothetical protein [Acidobacteriota bacterium]
MSREKFLAVTDADEARGTFERRVSPLESAAGAAVAVRLEDGCVVEVPARQLVERADGEFTLLASFEPPAGDERAARVADAGGVGVVPVVEERLRVGTREVETRARSS